MALIIYDSAYGNTKRIAEAIAETIGAGARCIFIDDIEKVNLNDDLLIVGCPINAWHPTPKVTEFLKSLSSSQLSGVSAASFDTRIDSIFSGNAARRIASGLKKAGAIIVTAPQGFYVKATAGPLADGEIEKAKEWARSLMKVMHNTHSAVLPG
ncbi:MAG: hypothetical protein BGO70_10125 [Bacteroidetes bacterium 43-93]|nr:flavodoxin domain-containing protein [Bacteroidota bacterium]OJX00512.1 MAG: hypothetical protein BGO70_10125 [Bacteroidetes bacterium 43-93]